MAILQVGVESCHFFRPYIHDTKTQIVHHRAVENVDIECKYCMYAT